MIAYFNMKYFEDCGNGKMPVQHKCVALSLFKGRLLRRKMGPLHRVLNGEQALVS